MVCTSRRFYVLAAAVASETDSACRGHRKAQLAFFLASRSQVSTTVSGFSDTDSMP